MESQEIVFDFRPSTPATGSQAFTRKRISDDTDVVEYILPPEPAALELPVTVAHPTPERKPITVPPPPVTREADKYGWAHIVFNVSACCASVLLIGFAFVALVDEAIQVGRQAGASSALPWLAAAASVGWGAWERWGRSRKTGRRRRTVAGLDF